MLCESTKTLMQTILHSLTATEQTGWDDPTELGNECLFEMHQMTRPSYRAHKTTGSEKWPSHLPNIAAFSRAMPHVKAMMTAIRRKNRITAVENGNAALAEMNGSVSPRASKFSQAAESTIVRQHEEPAAKHRPVIKERNSPRRSLGASGN